MANPPRQKGTGAETELVQVFADEGLVFVRTSATSGYDLTNANPHRREIDPLEALATRPDRGQWLITLRVKDFARLLSLTDISGGPQETHVEVKRYKRFSLHSIFEGKFKR